MARHCAICGKTKQMAVTKKLLRGNYNPTAKRYQHPNLQPRTVNGKRSLVCTRCIKSGRVVVKRKKTSLPKTLAKKTAVK